MKKTAIVLLNWNGISFLQQFLPIVIRNSPSATVIVIDNQSTDESVSYLQNNHPEVEIIVNPKNEGFAKGYNEGLKRIEGRFTYYVLLNSDVEVTENWLVPLTEKLDSNPTIAAVQPKILAYHQQDKFEHAGASGGFMDKNYYPFCRGRLFDAVEVDHQQYDNEKEVFWTSGACMMIRSSVYHELGGFDEHFFAHMEEIDLCWRAKRKNYAFYILPASTVYHVGGGTLNYESPNKTFLNFRNNLYMIHKNHEGWLFGKIFYRLCLDGVAGARYFLGGKWKHLFAIIKAHFSYYRHLPTLKKQRKELKENSTTFNAVGLYKASLLWAYFFKGIKTYEGLNKRFLIEK